MYPTKGWDWEGNTNTRDKKGKRKLNKGVDCRVDGGRV